MLQFYKSKKILFFLIFSFFCFILLFVFLECNLNAMAQESNEIDSERIDKFVQHEMSESNIPGLSLGIIKDDKIIYLKGFGTAGPGKCEVTPNTSFILGSVSKSFTGLAVMQLVEKGAINLDDPVKKYIPWFSIGGPGVSDRITILNLLNHTSGIPAFEGHDSGIERGSNVEERIKLKNNIKLNHPVGSTFEYSSLNYDILGVLIQVVSNQSYEEYIQSNIFKPLEMTNSYAALEEASKGNLAMGYIPWFGFQIPTEVKYSKSALPSGYIISSAEDMTHFLIAFINKGMYKQNNILSENGITQALASIGNTSYGAGWFSAGYYKWHTGELANYNAYICIVPSEKLGIIMLSNTNDIGVKFLNHGSSSLRRIPEGVRVLLVGGELPDDIWLSTKTMYILVDLVIILILVLIIRLLFWPLRSKLENKKSFYFVIRTLVALIISIVMLSCVPVWVKGSWHALMISVPDLTLSIMAISLLLLTASIINIVMLIKKIFGRKTASNKLNIKGDERNE
jgi:CubicO group peptidase (beta-lactamase class C family)